MNSTELSIILDNLSIQPVGVGIFLAGAGFVFLILGHRVFRVLIAASFGAIGYVFGCSLMHTPFSQFAVGMLGGFALGTLALFFVRGAVAVLTGAWCAAIAWQLGSQFLFSYMILGTIAGIIFVAAVSLTFVVYEEMIAFVTSLEGSFLSVAALVILFSHHPTLWSHVRHLLLANPVFGAFVILTGTVTGFYFQIADVRHKHTGAGL